VGDVITDEKKLLVANTELVGGGFIGLEMAENLVKRGIAVTLLEMLPQVMPPLDPESGIVLCASICSPSRSILL